jgi:adenylate kinase family enzyme
MKKHSILLITGLSGSGKSTIGKIIEYRFKNVLLVDTDDIDDKSFTYLFENNSEFKNMVKSGTGEPHKIHEKMNFAERDKIIENNPDKNIVFVGMTVPLNNVDHVGYFLDTPTELNFRFINRRTIRDICKNSQELEEMYSHEDPAFIDVFTLFKFKIRRRFPIAYDDIKQQNAKMKEKYASLGYKIMTGQEIIDDLKNKNILEPSIKLSNAMNEKLLIMHIAGAQGSGKSHMGEKLKLYVGDLIYVKDLDILYSEFHEKKLTEYQKYIDEYIKTHYDKPIIFVGLDANICLGPKNNNKDKQFYDLRANHKFYIDLPDDQILKQRFFRQIQKLEDRRNELFTMWENDSKNTQDKLFRYLNLDEWQKNNEECRKHYEQRGYELLSYANVFTRIHSLLE